MPKYHVQRSIGIEAPQVEIGEILTDFRQWPIWSPWLVMDRETKLTYDGSTGKIGSSINWNGELTGKGSMKLASVALGRIRIDFDFVKPFNSHTSVEFTITSLRGGQSKVAWHMVGSIPFPLSLFVLKSVKSGVGMDYERGLRMLKEYCETGGVASAIEVERDGLIESSSYLGIAGQGNINDDIDQRIQACFDGLMDYLVLNGVETTGPSFVIYNEFNIDTGHMSYICAATVDSGVQDPKGAKVVRGELKAARAIKVRHTGSYQNLGNAWSTGMSFARYNKIKTRKYPTGIEIYRNSPDNVEPEDLDTEVLLLRQ